MTSTDCCKPVTETVLDWLKDSCAKRIVQAARKNFLIEFWFGLEMNATDLTAVRQVRGLNLWLKELRRSNLFNSVNKPVKIFGGGVNMWRYTHSIYIFPFDGDHMNLIIIHEFRCDVPYI